MDTTKVLPFERPVRYLLLQPVRYLHQRIQDKLQFCKIDVKMHFMENAVHVKTLRAWVCVAYER